MHPVDDFNRESYIRDLTEERDAYSRSMVESERRANQLEKSMDELRLACADILGLDPATWPAHGNAPLAIAAALTRV